MQLRQGDANLASPFSYIKLIISCSRSLLRLSGFTITLERLIAVPTNDQCSDEEQDGDDDHSPRANGCRAATRHNGYCEVVGGDQRCGEGCDVHEQHWPQGKGWILLLLSQPDGHDE